MKIRALVFEDNDNVRFMLSDILGEKGYEVFAYPDPSICLVYLEKKCPCPSGYTCADIIITDINMPGISGLEFLEHQMKHGCKVRNFGVISGEWSASQIGYARKLDCKILKKPFAITELEEWLDRCEENIDPKRRLWDFLIQDGFCGNP